MNDPYRQAPISKLHTDVLWRVFAINADMDNDFKSSYQYELAPHSLLALNVLRNSSQVCQRWRSLILESSSLWGCVIELRCLLQERNEWREEVIKRAGQSFLSIKGEVVDHPSNFQEFVFKLLMDLWPRIRKLDIEVKSLDWFLKSSWQVFQRPAPHLQVFKVYLYTRRAPLPDTSGSKRFFSDHAPLLQEFNLYPNCLPIIRLRAPWLSHIRKLSLHRPCPLTIDEILDMLPAMPLLEVLDIQTVFTGVEQQQLSTRPCITLPRLAQLICHENDTLSCFYLLYHILPASGCIPYVQTDSAADLTVEEVTLIRRVLVRYVQNYFTVNPVALCLSVNEEGFDLYQPFTESLFPHEVPSMFLVIQCRPSSAIPLFLDPLSPFISPSLTTLNFVPSGSITTGLPNIIELFESMSLLETLYSSPEGL
ncbi:hypothetical protein GALMADRAFT_222530 [Galerina marginata CBS 339.88]|uniref:F-box domain-containing protein n=1 Tax=Galerina marginata (strain CBS 339.88) TaxID=685588 RepID=A0A067TM20_GALM3|nr:hypothetical protein GALMADRAFT_222530 [Galerina marginata CBS 339.88]